MFVSLPWGRLRDSLILHEKDLLANLRKLLPYIFGKWAPSPVSVRYNSPAWSNAARIVFTAA